MSPILSFSAPEQKEKILSGQIRQTMRKPRKPKAEIHVGDKLLLWWKPWSKKEKKLLGQTVCTAKKRVALAEVWESETNAEKEGFNSLDEFRDWFVGGWRDAMEIELKTFLNLEVYDIIEWKLPLIQQKHLGEFPHEQLANTDKGRLY